MHHKTIFVIYGAKPYHEVKEKFVSSSFDRYMQLPITAKALYNLLNFCNITK